MRQLKIATQITNRDSQAVEKYLQEISKIPMITPEEETTLAQRIKMGDQRALDKLVQANLRFVVSVAKQYQHQGLSLSDLINEGNLGLIKAAQRFDETKGFKFISYAVWWIRQSILQALAEQGRLVRLPQNKIGTYNKANKAYMAFEQEHEREPSTEELAEILEMSETEINHIFSFEEKSVAHGTGAHTKTVQAFFTGQSQPFGRSAGTDDHGICFDPFFFIDLHFVWMLGEKKVEAVRIKNNQTQETQTIPISGFFVAIGHHPNSDIFKGWLDMDETGYLLTTPGTTKTNIEGVFAAGDVQDKNYRQAVTAAGSGCMGAWDEERYLKTKGLV